MKAKAISIISIFLALALLLSSCSGGIDTDEAKGELLSFFDALKRADTEKAQSLLHPEGDSLDECLEVLKDACGKTPSEGILVIGYSNYAYSYYHSDVDGSRYILTAKARISNKDFEFCVTFVKNDKGYGIYGFDTVE